MLIAFIKEPWNDFTYNTIAQANIEPANKSLENAKTFFRHCNAYLNQ